ncbi:hypothetical protein NDU88_001830 [Pleurodeles waltl]|uniref:Uncharacterized protein n=1 Tax=Pleurodeles waltl TaxID=8319 RepID=A0AAV7KSH5_PLEWA|nr:hypothetical protein NDU88_001830 [Pleurodeles waltl]
MFIIECALPSDGALAVRVLTDSRIAQSYQKGAQSGYPSRPRLRYWARSGEALMQFRSQRDAALVVRQASARARMR